jgi:hypothetical protein
VETPIFRGVDSPSAAEVIPQRTGLRWLLPRFLLVPIFFLIVFAVGFFLRPLDKLTGKPDPKLPVAAGASFSTGAATGVGVLAVQLEIHVGGCFDYGTVQLQGNPDRHIATELERC